MTVRHGSRATAQQLLPHPQVVNICTRAREVYIGTFLQPPLQLRFKQNILLPLQGPSCVVRFDLVCF